MQVLRYNILCACSVKKKVSQSSQCIPNFLLWLYSSTDKNTDVVTITGGNTRSLMFRYRAVSRNNSEPSSLLIPVLQHIIYILMKPQSTHHIHKYQHSSCINTVVLLVVSLARWGGREWASPSPPPHTTHFTQLLKVCFAELSLRNLVSNLAIMSLQP